MNSQQESLLSDEEWEKWHEHFCFLSHRNIEECKKRFKLVSYKISDEKIPKDFVSTLNELRKLGLNGEVLVKKADSRELERRGGEHVLEIMLCGLEEGRKGNWEECVLNKNGRRRFSEIFKELPQEFKKKFIDMLNGKWPWCSITAFSVMLNSLNDDGVNAFVKMFMCWCKSGNTEKPLADERDDIKKFLSNLSVFGTEGWHPAHNVTFVPGILNIIGKTWKDNTDHAVYPFFAKLFTVDGVFARGVDYIGGEYVLGRSKKFVDVFGYIATDEKLQSRFFEILENDMKKLDDVLKDINVIHKDKKHISAEFADQLYDISSKISKLKDQKFLRELINSAMTCYYKQAGCKEEIEKFLNEYTKKISGLREEIQNFVKTNDNYKRYVKKHSKNMIQLSLISSSQSYS